MNTRVKKTLSNLGLLCGVICTSIIIAGCQPNKQSQSRASNDRDAALVIPLSFRFGEEPIECDQTVMINTNPWKINQLAFFVSGLAVKTTSSDVWQSIPLVPSDWQTERTALVWFNNGCRSGVNTVHNHSLTIDNAQGVWQAATEVRFELAVPFAENHSNPLTQASPLNIPDMFWSWQLGHKFLRLDLATDADTPRTSWSYHLGSVGCQSASSMRAPQKPCSMPNRFELSVAKPPAHGALFFDLAALLNNVEPSTMRSCMFQQLEEVACIQLANNLRRGTVFGFSESHPEKLNQQK